MEISGLPIVAFHYDFVLIKILLFLVVFVYHTRPNSIIGSIVSYFFLFVVAFDRNIDNTDGIDFDKRVGSAKSRQLTEC